MASLLFVACGDGEKDPSPAVSDDIVSYLRKPGMITHVRYTSYTPPWPTRTEAWIDWDNNRVRSWHVQWTDSPTNPSICTSIQDGDVWYLCLPSLEKIGVEDFPRLYSIWPRIPLRASETEVSVPAGVAALFGGGDETDSAPLQISANATTTTKSQGGTEVVVNSWEIADFDFPCGEPGETEPGSANFDYTVTNEGEPISEFITMSCGEESFQYVGIVYHEVEFVEPSDVADDFFNAEATRASMLEDQLSSAAAQVGTVFWLGEQPGEWALQGIEHDSDHVLLGYSRGDGEDQEAVSITTRVGTGGYYCANAEPIPNDAYGGALCRDDDSPPGDRLRIVWAPQGFDLWLEVESYPEEMSRQDMLALAGALMQWDQQATSPLLTNDDVRNLVGDSLELVCPTGLRQIREARSASSFTFDRESGEWTGVFGSFGEYAVPDSKPVAIPVSEREEVESTLSHNAAQFAPCTQDEEPPPQAGDDDFGVEFVEQDDSGLTFEITGVDGQIEAALVFCMGLDSGGCRLTDPAGMSVDSRGVDIEDIRAHVLRIRVGVEPGRLAQAGTWQLSIDLGEGRTAETTFDVR